MVGNSLKASTLKLFSRKPVAEPIVKEAWPCRKAMLVPPTLMATPTGLNTRSRSPSGCRVRLRLPVIWKTFATPMLTPVAWKPKALAAIAPLIAARPFGRSAAMAPGVMISPEVLIEK